MKRSLMMFLAGTLVASTAHADLAQRIRCDIQTAGPESLQTLTWQQGTTPLIRLDVFDGNLPVTVDPLMKARMLIGPSGTNDTFAVVTNQTVGTTYYQVQWPTVGTNTTGAGWWYTIYFEKDGHRYWTGNGRLYIEATTSTDGDGLRWQEVLSGALPSILSWDVVEWYVNTLTNGPYRAGSGIAATTNADGSVSFSATGGMASVSWDDVEEKPSVFAPDTHTHGYADVTDPPWLSDFSGLTGSDISTAGGLTNPAAFDPAGSAATVSNLLGPLAFKSSITSNQIDTATDAAYRGGGETLWPASSNDVLTHVASHGVLPGGGFVAGPGADGGTNAGIAIGPMASNDGSDGVAIGKGATTAGGVAIGALSATLNDATGEPLEAIQLGQGTNTTWRSFQVYNYQLLTALGYIPSQRLINLSSNQLATATDKAYRNSAATGITSNQMDQATDEAYRSATGVVPVYWSMGMSANQDNLVRTNYNVLAFNVNQFSTGATVDTNTYTVTFGTTGVYLLYLRTRHSQMDSGTGLRAKFILTGNNDIASELGDVYLMTGDSSGHVVQFSVLAKITNAAATVKATFYHSDTENDVDISSIWSVFTGHKIADL